MGLDLRIPIGVLFLAYGLLLGVYGFVRPQLVQDININLVWGIVLAMFGGVMLGLALARRAPATPPTPTTRPTGN
jgi:hypothetical protein